MGQAFGSTDGMDPSGNPLGQGATPDQLGISGPQAFARKALQGGLGGLGKGLQQQPGMMPKGGAPQINVPQAPTVDPSMFTGLQKPKNPFFGN